MVKKYKHRKSPASFSLRIAISHDLLEYLRDRADKESRKISGMARLILEREQQKGFSND